MSLIVVTPEQLELTGPRELSQRIIQALTKPDIVDVIGIGTSITGVVAAVNFSGRIANVNVQSASLDYIPVSVLGNQEAIFFELGREKVAIAPIIEEFEKQQEEIKMPQTVWVGRQDRLDSVTSIILWKINEYNLIKVVASGLAIITAVRSTLQVTMSGITREPVGISAITTESIERRGVLGKKVPAIHIYLERGKATVHSARHQEVIKKVTQR